MQNIKKDIKKEKKLLLYIVAISLINVPIFAHATKAPFHPPRFHKPKTDHPWKGTNVQFGLLMNSGNTTNKDLNAAVNINYTKMRWNNNTQLQAQIARDKGELTKEKYYAQDQLSYAFSKERINYLYGNGNITADHFSPYDYQSVVSIGLGRYLVKNDTVLLTIQAGPGLRRNKVTSTEEVSNNLIGTAQGQFTWHIGEDSKYGTFSQLVRDDFGKPYDYLKGVTSYQTQITKHLALRLSYTLEYYSNIPPFSKNTKNMDTTTTLNLVYNF